MEKIIELIEELIVKERILLEDGEITKENVENDIRLNLDEIIKLIEKEVLSD